MRTNFSLTFPTYSTMDNDTVNSRNGTRCYSARDLEVTIIHSIIYIVSLFGLMGNGTVIWILGFCMKRNPFTTYVLNLAVADFGVLISIPVLYIVDCYVTGTFDVIFKFVVAPSITQIMYSASQCLLTSISVDRCGCVLFPLWYRYHRPERLSTLLCTLIWLVSFLFNVICIFLHLSVELAYRSPVFFVFLGNAMVCLPLITISTLILVIRICLKPQLRQQGKLLTAILLSLFFFLTLAFPMNVVCLMTTYAWNTNFSTYNLVLYGLLCASLNSFVNPLIYFLVGRKKRGLCKENMKLILQRVFMEEEVHGVELEFSAQTLR